MGRANTRKLPRRPFVVDSSSTLLSEPQQQESRFEDDEFSTKQPQFALSAGDQIMGQEDIESVPTASAVRAFDGPGGYSYFNFLRRRSPSADLQSKEFVIPQTPTEIAAAAARATEEAAHYAQQDMQQDDFEDDISILTEYSGMEEEEDASSQITAGTEAKTVVTTTTGSTTIPTRNASIGLSAASQQYTMNKRRNALMDANNGLSPMDNSQFKRRRML